MAHVNFNIGGSHRGRRKNLELDTNRIPDDQGLPYETDAKGPRGCAFVCFTLDGLCVAAMAALIVLRGGPDIIPIVIVLVVVSCLFAFIGAAILSWQQHWSFSKREIELRARSIFGRTQWSEPISAYAGVVAREEYHSGGDKSPSYTNYILELRHRDDKKKTVKLYSSRSGEGFRQQWERYAGIFEVSALHETDDGLEERRIEDLDKSVRERVAEGTMAADFDPSGRPPETNLRVRIEGEAICLSTGNRLLGKVGRNVGIMFALFGAGMVVGGLLSGRMPLIVILPLAGAFLADAGLVLALVGRLLKQELLVAPERVRSRWVHPWGSFGERVLRSDAIEDVTVRTPPNSQGFTAVVIESDERTIWFGMGCSDEEKRWARDCVVAVISR